MCVCVRAYVCVCACVCARARECVLLAEKHQIFIYLSIYLSIPSPVDVATTCGISANTSVCTNILALRPDVATTGGTSANTSVPSCTQILALRPVDPTKHGQRSSFTGSKCEAKHRILPKVEQGKLKPHIHTWTTRISTSFFFWFEM